MRADVYQAVTDRIVEALEAGTVPWRVPWNASGGVPYNAETGRPYTGTNVLLLLVAGYDDPRWGTYEMWQRLGAQVKRGEKSTTAVLLKKALSKRKQGESEDDRKPYSFLKQFPLFNARQCDGVAELPKPEALELEPVERAEEIIRGYVWADARFSDRPIGAPGDNIGPPVFYGYSGAWYDPHRDRIEMPAVDSFKSTEGFYSTLFHEMIHSTGSKNRLSREELITYFAGGESRGKEELIAEIGASFLAGLAGMETAGGDQSAAYIESWLGALRNDKTMVVGAAGAAQRAVDMIVGKEEQFEVSETNGEDLAVAA